MESKIDPSNRWDETPSLIMSVTTYSSLVPSVLWQRLALRDLYYESEVLDGPRSDPQESIRERGNVRRYQTDNSVSNNGVPWDVPGV